MTDHVNLRSDTEEERGVSLLQSYNVCRQSYERASASGATINNVDI